MVEDAGDGVGAVEDIEVDAGDAVAPQILGLAGGVFDADGADGAVVVGVAFQLGVQLGGDSGAAEGGKAADLGGVQDGQDAGDDGDGNAGGGGAFQEGVVVGVVVEQLGDEEVGAQVLFHPGIGDVGVQAGGFGVALRVGGAGDAEVGVEVAADVGDQVGGVGEFVGVGAGGGVGQGGGAVAAQGDDVGDAGGVESLEDGVDGGAGLGDAG